MTAPKSIGEIAERLKKMGQRLKPMNSDEIKSVEQYYNILLPERYKQFLSLMGKDAGDYMKGSSVFFDEIFQLKLWTQKLFEENGIEQLPEDWFVFWMHQGYQTAFFKVSQGSDPPVYYFSEGYNYKTFILKESSLTDFFCSQWLMSFHDNSLVKFTE